MYARVRPQAVLFLLSMLAAQLAGVAVPPGGAVLAGASGGAYGVIGAWMVLILRQWRSPSPVLRRARWAMPILLIAAFALSFVHFPDSDRIAWSAHFGGLAGGMAAMALLSRGAGPVPLGRSPRWMRWAGLGLAALFLWGVAVDVQRITSGRVCEVLGRDGWTEADREAFTAALREMPVSCPSLAPEAPPAT